MAEDGKHEITWDLPRHWVEQSRSNASRTRLSDSTGGAVTGRDSLLRTMILLRVLRRHLSPQEQNVGVLLPPSVPGALANFALAVGGYTSVNLNYTASESILNSCIATAELRHVITSRRAMDKFSFKLDAELIYLEDVRDQVTKMDKAAAFLACSLRSTARLANPLGKERGPDTPLTIIFTSGSTGEPKGVVLTYENIAANIRGVAHALSLTSKDVVLGVLPFFHSFGYTVTLWAPSVLPLAAVYHFNPLDAKQIGKLAQSSGATILLATPTFLRSYLRRVEPSQFKTLELVVVGAEKEPQTLSDAFHERFGVRPIEGYGMTEMGPLVSVNVPPSRAHGADRESGLREGSVGRPLPGVEAKVLSLEDGHPVEPGEEGMLYVRGPSLMPGYLKRPELTAKAMRDGWYETGDIARIDESGFIHLTGRQSRFSKIGGEMVPHIAIEEAIIAALGESTEGDAISTVVTAVPDEKRGERIVVLHKELSKPVGEILRALNEGPLPKLYLPAESDFYRVDEIPILGSGKLDLKAIRELALAKAGGKASD